MPGAAVRCASRRATEREGAGQVKVADRVGGDAVADPGVGDADARGDLGVRMPGRLRA
jgi:hypothetical protein